MKANYKPKVMYISGRIGYQNSISYNTHARHGDSENSPLCISVGEKSNRQVGYYTSHVTWNRQQLDLSRSPRAQTIYDSWKEGRKPLMQTLALNFHNNYETQDCTVEHSVNSELTASHKPDFPVFETFQCILPIEVLS
jgi:hypothetical protein